MVSVNYIDIAFILLFVIAAIVGYCRGLLINIINFFRFAVGMFLCFSISSYGAKPVYDAFLKQRCLDTINEKIVTTGNIDEVVANLNEFGSSLPKVIADAVNYKSIDFSSEDLAQSILTNIFEPVAVTVTKSVIFIAVFVIFFGATAVIIHLAKNIRRRKDDKRGRESALKKTDRILGLLLGLLKAGIIALAITSILMYIISLKDNAEVQSAFIVQAENSKVLMLLDKINPFNAITEGLL